MCHRGTLQDRDSRIQLKSKNVVILKAKSDSTYKLNSAKKSHQPNWESRNDGINSSKTRSKYLASG